MDFENFDIIIIGTGLRETILSAAFSRVGQKVLHVDAENHYGLEFQTLNLKEFIERSSLSNFQSDPPSDENIYADEGEKILHLPQRLRIFDNFQTEIHHNGKEFPSNQSFWEELIGNSKKFSIDLASYLLFSTGPLTKLLVESNVARYIEFRALDASFLEINGKIEKAPCSKANIFSSALINVFEKRLLMKFLKFAYTFDENIDDWIEHKDLPFSDFLHQRKLGDTLKSIILHAIALSDCHVTTYTGLLRTQRYLKSVGKYGNTPFIISSYGMSEIVQAFARLSAVFNGVFMLNKKVKAVAINNEDNTCKKIILDQGEIIRCRYVIASSIYFSQWAELHHKIARAFYITARSINFQEDYFFINDEYKNKQNAFLVVPQNTKILVTDDSSYEISSNVFITQLSERSSSCPQNYFIIYMRSQSLNLDAALKDLKMLENYYFCTSKNCSTQCYQKPHALYAARYIQNCYRTKSFSSEVLPKNCYVINNDPPEFDFEPIIKEAQRIFHQTCPDEEFLPTAPNPEDIIYDD